MNNLSHKKWRCIELPLIEYRKTWTLLKDLVVARKNKHIDTDIVLLLEHRPVFTIGKHGRPKNLKISKESLEKRGISLIRVERGGDITFHGPGQLVVYPVIDLRTARLSVLDYIYKLEEVMIRVCREWGIMAQRDFTHRGVWIGKNKLGSVGIAIRRGISFHGFSLNVNPSLKPFTWINPCGLEVVISSMEQELSQSISMNNVHRAIKNHLEEVFGIELLTTCLPELYSFLNNSRDLLKYQKNNNVKDYNIYHVGQNA